MTPQSGVMEGNMKIKKVVWVGASLLILAIVLLIIKFNSHAPSFSKSNEYDLEKINSGGSWKQVSEGIYIITGDYPDISKVNMVLITKGDKATLIDAGNGEAEGILVKNYLESNNISLENLILTHKHSDHRSNLKFLTKDKQVNIYTFDDVEDGQIINMGKIKFKIIFTPGHYDDRHISVELVNEKILVAGDVVVTSYLPLIVYGGNAKTLENTLNKLKENNYELIIPGHGDIVQAKEAIDTNLEYLENAMQKVSEIVDRNGDVDELNNIKAEECVSTTQYLDRNSINIIHMGNLTKIYYDLKKGN